MKKFLVLTLVLGMASLANATLSIVVDGADVEEITINELDTIMIGVYEDTDGSANYTGQTQVLVALLTTDLASWTGVTEVYSPPAIIPTSSDVWTYYGTGVDPTLDVYYGNFASGSPTDYALAGIFGELELQCNAASDIDDVTVIMYSATDMSELDRVTIHQIPEPMTFALLGLGGLFLRRRK